MKFYRAALAVAAASLTSVVFADSYSVPAGTVETAVYVSVPIAETVIVGRVPDSYTSFEGDEKWDESLERFDILN